MSLQTWYPSLLTIAGDFGKKRICILSFQGHVARVQEEEEQKGRQAQVSLVEEGPRVVPLKTCINRLCRSMYRINLSAICQRWVVSSCIIGVSKGL